MRVNLSVAIVAMVNSTSNSSGPSNITNHTGDGTCPAPIKPGNSTSDDTGNGTFDWDETTQSIVLGCFFYGYVLSQIPGGRAAEKFGGKWIFGIGILITSVFTILMPIAAKTDFKLLVAVRVIEGLGEGVTFPVMHAMLAQWSPPLERSKLSTFIYAGSMCGTILSLPLTGLICDSLGWEAAFYCFGAVGVLWFVFWAIFVYDTPAKHPFISKEERDLIEISLGKRPLFPSLDNSIMSESIRSELDGSNIGQDDEQPIISISGDSTKAPPIPYRAIFTSMPFYAILIAHTAQNWSFYTLLSELPTYMSQILHFNIRENAFLSAVPYLCMWIFAVMGSHVADYMRSKGYWTTTKTRKIMNTLAFIPPAICLVMIYFAGCNKEIVIALLCATVGLNGFNFSSVSCNHIDIAPRFAGTLMGFTNSVANTMGFVAPYIIGQIIDGHEDLTHWQIVFFIAAGVYTVGNLVYCLMASGEEQPWNRIEDNERTLSANISGVGPIISAEDLIDNID